MLALVATLTTVLTHPSRAWAFGPSPTDAPAAGRLVWASVVLVASGLLPFAVILHVLIQRWLEGARTTAAFRVGFGGAVLRAVVPWVAALTTAVLSGGLPAPLPPALAAGAFLLALRATPRGLAASPPAEGTDPGRSPPHGSTAEPPSSLPVLPTPLWLAFAAVPGIPLLFGGGIDLPDDAIYSSVATWEWLRTALLEGRNPFWVPGRLGGQSLFAEAVQMAPLYPAAALLPLPTSFGWPLACLLHGVLSAVTVRGLGRAFGLSEGAARLASWGWVLGTVGTTAFIEAQTDTFPLILWFPAVLLCWERVLGAPDNRSRDRWTLAGAAALALILLGGHVRHGAGACAALGVWFVVRAPRALPRALLLSALGLAWSAPTWWPAVAEWSQARSAGGLMPALAVPPHQWLRPEAFASLAVPRTYVTAREYGVGAVLATGLAAWWPKSTLALRRLALWMVLLVVAAADPQWAPLRLVVLPLTWLSHPVTILHAMLACLAMVILGAQGVERLTTMEPPSRALRWAALAIAAPAVLASARVFGLWAPFPSDSQGVAAVEGLAIFILLAAAFITAVRFANKRRAKVVVALAGIELLTFTARSHLAVPSRPLPFAERRAVAADGLDQGSVDVAELRRLGEDGLHWVEHWQSGGPAAVELDGEAVLIEEDAPLLQRDLFERPVPAHIAVGRGWPSLSGRARMPSARAHELIAPVVQRLSLDGEDDPPVEAQDAHAMRLIAGGVGPLAQAARLARTPTILLPSGTRATVPVDPPCRVASAVEVIPESARRVVRLLAGPPEPGAATLIESPPPTPVQGVTGTVRCTVPTTLEVEASRPAAVVVAVPHHPGWRWRSTSGRAVLAAPADQIQTVIFVEAGTDQIRGVFTPPGLLPGCAAAAIAAAAALWILRRRSAADSAPA